MAYYPQDVLPDWFFSPDEPDSRKSEFVADLCARAGLLSLALSDLPLVEASRVGELLRSLWGEDTDDRFESLEDVVALVAGHPEIVERREGRSAAAQATAEADARFRARSALLVARASEMMTDLSSDPMFANVMGYPEVSIRREDADSSIGVVSFAGPAGVLSFQTFDQDKIEVSIYPAMIVRRALGCGLSYGIDPLKGELSRIDDLTARVRDHIAEFLADIHLSPATHILQPESQGLTG